MDFTYNYIRAQDNLASERFRSRVEAWLDANIPEDLTPAVCRQPSAADWPALNRLRRLLGKQGWLAAQETKEQGGLEELQGHATVLGEALDKRGLAWMRDRGAEALRRALDAWANPSQILEFMGPLTRGETVIWHTPLEPETDVDASSIEILATGDGDDYVLDGRGRFAGIGPAPDLVWALVRLCPESTSGNPDLESTFSCLIPAGSEGIEYPPSRNLTPAGPRTLAFNQVRVPRYFLLGPPAEGVMVMQNAVTAATNVLGPHAGDPEAAGLQQYLLDAVDAGEDIDQQEIQQQSVMDSYIDDRVSRLFRMRDAWMRAMDEPFTYQPAQTRLWEGRAAMRLAETVRQVIGPYSLLDHKDPRAPVEGRFELQQRYSLDRNSSQSHWLVDRNTIARHLGLGQTNQSCIAVGVPGPGLGIEETVQAPN